MKNGIIVVMAVSEILFEPSLYLNGWDKGEHCPLDCCQASPAVVTVSPKELCVFTGYVVQYTLNIYLNYGQVWALFSSFAMAGFDVPGENWIVTPLGGCMLPDVSLPTQSLWANVWSTLWMACTAPVGKSHTVWHFTAETVNGKVKQGQTSRKESLAADHLFVASFFLHTPQSEWCQWHYTFIIDLLHSVYEVA